jgi:hypothetical protein
MQVTRRFGLGTRIGAKSRLPNTLDISDGHEEIGVYKGWKDAENPVGALLIMVRAMKLGHHGLLLPDCGACQH